MPPSHGAREHGAAAEPSRRLPRGFGRLIAAQFASALADNALLIVAVALLQQRGLPGWWAPLLKFGFMLSYVLLAPFVGALADAFAKARVMAAMNAVKVAGVATLFAGLHPAVALAIVGLGAAAYAPAKYGLITELVDAEALVAANAWIEVSVVAAALLGFGLGGLLVSPAWLGSAPAASTVSALGAPATGMLSLSVFALIAVYALSSVLNLCLPDSGARYDRASHDAATLLRVFIAGNRTLWRDPEAGVSLAATTIFWGVGATLQFAVLQWSADVLKLGLDRAAYLQATVAVGVIAGAAAAGRWVALQHARRLLGAGIALGLMMPLVASLDAVGAAVAALSLVGAIGGFMVVPLNALLQHRGHRLLTAGRSIAVQGFNENLSVLGMLGAYAICQAAGVPVVTTLSVFGLAIAAAMAGLTLVVMRRHARANTRPGLRTAPRPAPAPATNGLPAPPRRP